jgi:hypothetical protein
MPGLSERSDAVHREICEQHRVLWNSAVGQIDAILDFCVKAAPRLSACAHTYRMLFAGAGRANCGRLRFGDRRGVRLLEGTSPEQLTELRNSDEYRKAYESVSEFAGKIDSHNVARFCAENATEQK